MLYLAGEWVPAWLAMSITFLVAALGVSGLGWWVLRGDARNRRAEGTGGTPEQTTEHH
ncbi:MAG TPA: hypothetical protein VNA65_08145 [Candidatus Dormibacteraeota bacterium]|nr:hypothetical protein [Candidatus Dormibacteraeota bacterium]